MLLISAMLLSTASFAWFSMNTTVRATGVVVETYSDSIFLEIGKERDGDYAYSVDFDSNDKATRLVSLATLGDLDIYMISPLKVADGTYYNPTDSNIAGKTYYEKIVGGAANDTLDVNGSYRVVTNLEAPTNLEGYYHKDNIEIKIVTSADTYSGGEYYKLVGNDYVLQTLSPGDALYGLYEITPQSPEGSDSYYEYSASEIPIYYEVTADKVSPVGGLSRGSLLENYYTIEDATEVTTYNDTDEYYVLNQNGDYSYLGVISFAESVGGVTVDENGDPLSDTIVADEYYLWYRAYSSTMENAEADSTLSVINNAKYNNENNPYYLYETLYLRMREDAGEGKNLRVSGVTVNGEDSVSDSLRIFFVATNERGQVSRAIYNNRDKSITHIDSTNLFDTLLGDENDVVEVQIYFYFDGRDASALTEDYYILGQSVEIEFSVDKPEYEA